MAVRAAASLCVHLAREGGCALLLPGDRRPVDIGHDLGAWPALHARLALVEAGGAPPARRARAARRRGHLGHRRGPRPRPADARAAARRRALRRLADAAARRRAPRSRWPAAPARLVDRAGRAVGAGGRGMSAAAPPRPRAGSVAARAAAARRRPAGRGALRRLRRARRSFARAPTGVRGARRRSARRTGAAGRRRSRPLAGAARRRAGRAGAPLRSPRSAPLGARAPLPRLGAARCALASSWSPAVAGCSAWSPPGLRAAAAAARRNWDELADGLDRGLAGAQIVDWPYDGADDWVRLTILLGAPLLADARGALAFWPARRGVAVLRGAGARARCCSSTALPATEHDPGAPLLRGLALLAPGRRLAVAAAAGAPRGRRRGRGRWLAVGVAVAARGRGARRRQRLVGLRRPGPGSATASAITFDWTHSYGPLDWPRDGTTLLNVKSDRPHYWKAETLDSSTACAGCARPARTTSASAPSCRCSARTATAAGTTTSGTRAGTSALASPSARSRPTWSSARASPTWSTASSATLEQRRRHHARSASRCEKGDSYAVARLRARPDAGADARGAGRLSRQPGALHADLAPARRRERARRRAPGDASRGARRADASARRRVPLRECRLRRLAGSPRAAARVALRRRSTTSPGASPRTQPTTYDAVKTVESYLQRNYTYSERPPSREYPLDGVPVRGQDRLLPAVLRRDGADAAHGRHPGARGGRLLARLATTRTAASTASATSTRTPGSRSTSPASAGSRSTRRPPPRRPSRSRRRSGHERRARRRRRGAGAGRRRRRGRLRARDRHGRRRRPRRRQRRLLPLLLRRWPPLAVVAAAGRPPRPPPPRARPRGARRGPARRAAPRAGAARLGGAGATPRCWGSSGGSDRIAGPAAARYAAALRAHRYDPRAPGTPGPGERAGAAPRADRGRRSAGAPARAAGDAAGGRAR